MDAEADHDMLMEEAVSSALSSSMEKDQVLSPEDLAWVDSCLVPASDVPESSSWDMVRDALLDVLSSQPDDTPVTRLPRVISKYEESGGGVGEEIEEKDDVNGDARKEISFENAFLPTYNESVVESGDVREDDDLGFEFGFVLDESKSEPSVDEIFKVWELETLTEEGEFVAQLNNALKSVQSTQPISAEIPHKTLPISVDDVPMARWKDTKFESIEDLIAGISDLSLSQSSG